MRLDQLTLDIDLNSFWVLREILQANYRPRSLTVEFNRNLGPYLPFVAMYMPKWVQHAGSLACYSSFCMYSVKTKQSSTKGESRRKGAWPAV